MSKFVSWGRSAKRVNPIWVPKIVPTICLDNPYGTNHKDSRGTINQPTLLTFISNSTLSIYFFHYSIAPESMGYMTTTRHRTIYNTESQSSSLKSFQV